PKDVHPHCIRREGALKTNHHQRTPYQSKDCREDSEAFGVLCEVLKPIFDYVAKIMMANFLDKFEKLSIYCQVLPMMGVLAPGQPFSGIVLNLCVSTRANRDSMDNLLCVVIFLGKLTGGKLCLHKARLVFKGRSGDVIIFCS
ncbi:hypothetical protein PLICRDRAFT_120109, partial [Plicaturopsis crispa FD-325 SS-3]